MRALIQRVKYAKVTVNNEIVGSIGSGLCVFVGVTHTDDTEKSRKLAKKITNLRIFDDSEGVMNLSPLETGSEILVVSQFTLLANLRRGNRPSFINAAKPALAKKLYDKLIQKLKNYEINVEQGRFGAQMFLDFINDGPVTIIMDGRNE